MFGIKTIATGLVVGALLGGGAGLGGVALWNKTPWSASSKLEKARDDLVSTRADLKVQTQLAKDRLETISKRDALINEISGSEAVDASQSAVAWGAQCSAAFNAGLSAGRSICNAKSPSPAGQPAAGVVRPSFRTEFGLERYTAPADRLPGAGQR